VRWVRETIDDGGLALRLIRRHFLFSATVVATLSLGIGASTAMFSAVYGVLLRPLPYADPNRLVVVWSAAAGDRTGKLTVPFGDFERWRRDARSFTSLAAASWFGGDSVLTGRGAPRALLDVRVSDNIFQVLGVSASIGRTFDGRDHSAGCVAVLSDRFWQSLGADDRFVGDALRLSGRSCTVVGVMPASFIFFPEPTDLWTVIPSATGDPANGRPAGVAVFGRLAPNATIATATSELRTLADAGAGERAPHTPRLVPVVNALHEEFTWLAGRNLRVTLLLLFGAVSCLLAIACLNVANLLLGRSIVRRHEIAIRSALGSSWVRVLRQLTTETLCLPRAARCAAWGWLRRDSGICVS
jgi:putative ABC transport system permease protein